MKAKIFSLGLLVAVVFVFSLVSAQVPNQINYQGKLTTPAGGLMDTVVSMQFSIYADSTTATYLWRETQSSVTVNKSVFNVILGSVTPIPDNVFDGSVRYLGVKVGTDSEMSPRKPIVSVGYAYKALEADTADYSRSGAPINCSDCDTVFVNVIGPDSVIATSGTAFLGKVSGSSEGGLYGVQGYAENTSIGNASGGHFSTSSEGAGIHYGVVGDAFGSSSNDTYGSCGYAANTSTGSAIGGYFVVPPAGTGTHYGVMALSKVWFSDNSACGVWGYAENVSTGPAYGGYFSADQFGEGTHYGVYGFELAGGSGAAVYAAGDFAGSGAKYAVVKTSKGHRLLSVIESPEVWFEDFGEGQLINGKAHIEIDPLFLETVTINNLHPMKVFIQLTSGEPMTVVVNKGITGFDVVTSDNTSNATFDYRVVAKRKGYETERMRETDVGEDDPNLYPELLKEMEKRHQEERMRMEKEGEKEGGWR